MCSIGVAEWWTGDVLRVLRAYACDERLVLVRRVASKLISHERQTCLERAWSSTPGSRCTWVSLEIVQAHSFLIVHATKENDGKKRNHADTILAELSAHHHGHQIEEVLQARDAAEQPTTSRQLSDDDTRGALFASNVVVEPEHHPTTTNSADAAEEHFSVNQGKEQVCGDSARSTLAERLAGEDAAKVARRQVLASSWGLDQVAAAHESGKVAAAQGRVTRPFQVPGWAGQVART